MFHGDEPALFPEGAEHSWRDREHFTCFEPLRASPEVWHPGVKVWEENNGRSGTFSKNNEWDLRQGYWRVKIPVNEQLSSGGSNTQQKYAGVSENKTVHAGKTKRSRPRL